MNNESSSTEFPKYNSVYDGLKECGDSKEIYRNVNLTVGGFLTIFIASFGAPGNFLNCLVFWRQGLRGHMNLCLFCLSSVDFIFQSLLLSLGCLCVFAFLSDGYTGEEQYYKCIQFIFGLLFALKCTSVSYNTIIAVERCLCVVFPLTATFRLNVHLMAFILFVVAILNQLCYLPLDLKYVVKKIEDGKISSWHLVESDMWRRHKEVFYITIYLLMMIVVPIALFIVASIATLITVLQLQKRARWREMNASTSVIKSDHQTALTKMLVIVSIVFIACKLPTVVNTLLIFVIPMYSSVDCYLFYLRGVVTTWFTYIDSSVNICIYYCRSLRFRSEVRLIFLGPKMPVMTPGHPRKTYNGSAKVK